MRRIWSVYPPWMEPNVAIRPCPNIFPGLSKKRELLLSWMTVGWWGKSVRVGMQIELSIKRSKAGIVAELLSGVHSVKTVTRESRSYSLHHISILCKWLKINQFRYWGRKSARFGLFVMWCDHMLIISFTT